MHRLQYCSFNFCCLTLYSIEDLLFLCYSQQRYLKTFLCLGVICSADASSIGGGILLGLVLFWFVLENFVLEKYLRYIFTVYPVLIFAHSGVVVRHANDDVRSSQNIILASVNISVCLLLFIERIALSIYRCKRRRCSTNAKPDKEEVNVDQI